MTAPGPTGSPLPVLPTGDGGAPDGTGGVPTPPRGPGVSPPFAAPPIEGRNLRVWLGLGVAALSVLLCCGGGAAAVVGLFLSASQAVEEQAQAAVDDYLGAVRNGDYDGAYRLLCSELQRRESPREFARRLAAQPAIVDYRVGDARVNADLIVVAEVTYRGGARDTLSVRVTQDTRTGAMAVCGIS